MSMPTLADPVFDFGIANVQRATGEQGAWVVWRCGCVAHFLPSGDMTTPSVGAYLTKCERHQLAFTERG